MNQRPNPVMRASLLSSWRGFASSFAAAPTAPSRSWFFHQPNGTFIARRDDADPVAGRTDLADGL
jgi:hypothetical protein